MNILARNVTRRGAHPFVSAAHGEITYRMFERLSSQAAHAFQSLGVKAGDRVIVALGNSVEHLVAAFGVLKAGAVHQPLDPTRSDPDLGHILSSSHPALIVTTGEHADTLRAASDTLRLHASTVEFDTVAEAVAAMERSPSPAAASRMPTGAAARVAGMATSFAPLLARSPTTRPRVTLTPDDPSLLLYSPGTTGAPRGALFAHRAIGGTGLRMVEALGITSDDTVLTVAPLAHGFGWTAVETALHAAATLAFPATFEPSRFWPLAYGTGATVLFADRGALARILLRRPSPREQDSPLRLVVGPGSGTLRDELVERWGVDHVADCFWSTETSVVTITPDIVDLPESSCGQPLSGIHLRILGEGARELGQDEIGEITVQSPHALSIHVPETAPAAEPLPDGWLATGDLGWLDEDGSLHFLDRKDDAVRRGTDLVSSVHIEQALAAHPRVSDVAVVGVDAPHVGQEIKAIVVANGNVTQDELCTFASRRLPESQVPRLWEFRPALPRTHARAVEKYKLRGETRRKRNAASADEDR
jgi:acyl-CoA synthetase (AMP-forming)/AMP-acid ligase II